MNGDNCLLISGLEHFAFCRRQWALIHIERQWADNGLTTEGSLLHQRVHDAHATDVRNGVLTIRDLPCKSDVMKITGRCDAVEFIPCEHGITLNGRSGEWRIRPVEYKHGRAKANDCDRLQVVAEAMCLEEMFCAEITEGAVFYHETRKKEIFPLTDALRETVRASFREMHEYYSRGYTPVVKKHSGCKSCSLAEVCLPSLMKEKGISSVKVYMKAAFNEGDEE